VCAQQNDDMFLFLLCEKASAAETPQQGCGSQRRAEQRQDRALLRVRFGFEERGDGSWTLC